MEKLLRKYRTKFISLRSFIGKVKNNLIYIYYVTDHTKFLDEYNPDILERLYYILNDTDEIVKCKYCDKKAKWSGRMTEGYKTTCCSKECESKRLSELRSNMSIAPDRNKKFIEAQSEVTKCTDDTIKSLIKFNSQLSLITNNVILDYLKNRYTDSDSISETVHRIKKGIEEKPKCPVCGNPVTFIGKKSMMFSKYCSNQCAYADREKKSSDKPIIVKENKIKEKKETVKKEKNPVTEKQNNIVKQDSNIQETHNNTPSAAPLFTNEDIMSITKLYNYIPEWLQELGYNIIHNVSSTNIWWTYSFNINEYTVYISNAFAFDESTNIRNREYAYKNEKIYYQIYSCISKSHLKRQMDLFLGCLTGEHIFSIEPLRLDFERCKNIPFKDMLTLNYKVGIDIVKYFQENEFYKEEKRIYAFNPILRRKLIENRIKYKEKTEDMLSVNDIMKGFKISAIHYGYSHFNPQWTHWFVNKYNLKTVYDPCGGWGHHMLGMLGCEKIVYNDLNLSTVNNVKEIKKYFDIEQLKVHYGDATTYVPEDVDGWFMCPPYYNIEIYNDKSFESEDDYKNFLNKIFDLWNNSNSNIFGLIIREDLVSMINYEYAESYVLNISNSHLGKKKHKEVFYIFKK